MKPGQVFRVGGKYVGGKKFCTTVGCNCREDFKDIQTVWKMHPGLLTVLFGGRVEQANVSKPKTLSVKPQKMRFSVKPIPPAPSLAAALAKTSRKPLPEINMNIPRALALKKSGRHLITPPPPQARETEKKRFAAQQYAPAPPCLAARIKEQMHNGI